MIIENDNLPAILNAIRTAVAATLSVLVARLVGMPEAYWAPLATLVVMQSTLSATLPLAIVASAKQASGHEFSTALADCLSAVRWESCSLFRVSQESAARAVATKPGCTEPVA
jgi:hypothetical protein